MGRQAVVRVAVSVTAVIGALAFTSTAGAAQPVGGGRYLGEGKFGEAGPLAALQVTQEARRLRSAGARSFVECRSGFQTLRFRLRGSRRVRIDRAGRFAFAVRAHRKTLSVRGVFTTRNTARISARTAPRGRCRATLTLHRSFEPPFSGCRTQSAKTLLESDMGRIFQQRQVRAQLYDPYFFTPVAYGCMFDVDRRVFLGENGTGVDGHGYRLANLRLAGPYAAFSTRFCPIDFCGWSVTSVDLRDGTVLRSAPSAGRPPATTTGPVTDLVLSETGSIAWIASLSLFNATEFEVWVSDTAGERRIERAEEIDPKSLTLETSTLRWRNGDQVRTTVLE